MKVSPQGAGHEIYFAYYTNNNLLYDNKGMDALQNWERLQDKKVLIVEDNKTSAILAKIYVKQTGIHEENIFLAGDGLQAVEMAQKELFDLIIMDIKMPNLDGIDATKRIRGGSNTSKIIAYTAAPSTIEDELDKELFDDIIIKPIPREVFTKRILDLLHMQTTNSEI